MKTLSFTSLFVAVVPLFAIACSSGDFSVGSDQSGATGVPTVDGGTSCVTDTDCVSGDHCGFEESDACTAVGKCFTSSGALCNSVILGCACDGTDINVGCTPLPTGYSSKPLLHDGACTGGAQDASTGGPCTQDSDCASTDQLCGFLESQACAAQGVCVPKNEGEMCNSISPGCACDGSFLNIACTQYPAGYLGAPLAHTGACDDAGK